MKKDMERLIEIADLLLEQSRLMKNELHTTNKIAIGVSVVNILTLLVIVGLGVFNWNTVENAILTL